jgi:cytochrome b561
MRHELAYDLIAKLLHWLVVLLLSVQFTIAWTMPPIHRGTIPEGLIGLHLSLGTLIMGAVIVRLLWRWGHPVPLAPDGVPVWQHRLAEGTHQALCALLLLVPVLGWMNASARSWRVGLFGFLTLPNIVPEGAAFGAFIGDVHSRASYALLGVIGLHLLAVLYHRFVLRDGVLRRMLPTFK